MANRASLGFIGAGNMAEAIARGVIRSGLYPASELCAADPTPARQQVFKQDLRIPCVADSTEAAATALIVILAVKPQTMEEALHQIKPALNTDTLIISIAAGITTGYIEKTLGGTPRVVRVMPNTPMLVGEGMTGIAPGKNATDADIITAERIFSAGGKTIRTSEDLINAVTALSGSGPAYVFYLVETLAAAAAKLGLPEDQAALLARQTVIGSAHLLQQSKDSPAELRKKVTSPGGTTQAAIESLQNGGLPTLIDNALKAAEQRSKELAK